MCACLILRDKGSRWLLAGVAQPFGRAPKVQAPVDQSTFGSARSSMEPLKRSGRAGLRNSQESGNMLSFVVR